jgi:PAS domain-containing protein
VAQLLGKNRVAAAGCQIARETKQLDPSLGTRNRRVDQKTGFLEDELDRAVAAWQFSAAGDSSNVVALDTLRSQATLLERERRFRELLDALPAVVYTTDAAGRITYYKQAAAQPERQGFGSRLLAHVLPVQVQARSRVDFAPSGVCTANCRYRRKPTSKRARFCDPRYA